MTRSEKARIVCERVAALIREVVPVGLGRWSPAFEFVAAASDRFMDRLKEWETEDSAHTRLNLEAASKDLVEAWAEAARQWTEAGQPALERPTDGDKVEVGVGELVS